MTNTEINKRPRRRSSSLFGPIVLIAIGAYFLLRNLGLVAVELNWAAAMQLWPLLLVFLGINVIVQQLPRPFGSLLSGLVGLVALAVFGYVLLFAKDNPLLARWGVVNRVPEWKTEPISFSREGVETAVVTLEFDNPGAEVHALNDSPQLLDGQITHLGTVQFKTEVQDGQADLRLATDNSSFNWINPANWFNAQDVDPWQIGLNSAVPTNLRLDVGNGPVEAELQALQLTDFRLGGGNGPATIQLPGGDYEVRVDAGNGSIRLMLPDNGRLQLDIAADNGGLTIDLPAAMEARLELDRGNGAIQFDQKRFQRVSGDEDKGVWQTEGYGDAANQVELKIDGGNGRIGVVNS